LTFQRKTDTRIDKENIMAFYEDEHLRKYKRVMRKHESEFTYIREHPEEYETKFDWFQALDYKWRLVKDALNNYKVDDSMHEKTTITIPLNESKIAEQQKYLEENQQVPHDE